MPRDAHLDDTTLAVLADGRATDADREHAEAHLADCADCRAALGDLVDVLAEGGAAAPDGLADRTLRRLRIPAAPRGGPMTTLRPLTAVAALLLAALGVALWSAARGDDPAGPQPGAPDEPPAAIADLPEAAPAPEGAVTPPARDTTLGDGERFLAHVHTDKPLYKPGEVVFARAVLLDAFTRKPVADDRPSNGLLVVKSARGEVVHRMPTRALDGVAAFHWQVPEGLAGGRYKIVASFPWLGVPAAEREIDVRAYRAPRLRTDLEFLKKAYGPGETVQATLSCTRAEGGASAMALVTAVARLDGEEIHRQDVRLDRQGLATVRFTLPAEIHDGVGTLALRIADGGITETAARTLPIVLRRVDLSFLPEGGELVAGVPCGVYFEARTVRDEPADVAGRIVDDRGREVAAFATVHEGRGRLLFTPEAGRSYHAELAKPAGIEAPVALPAVKAEGISLRAPATTYAADRPVRVIVGATRDLDATVALYARERELALAPVRLRGGQPAVVTLRPRDAASGVLRVTVFDASGTPQAERLVLRRPAADLRVSVTPDAPTSVPGGKLSFTIQTRDALGRGVPAVVGLAATDDAVLASIQKRERAPRLPTEALLGAEVSELKDAAAYLDGTAEGAARTDLLLGTQGWRRFAFLAPTAFRKTYPEAGGRVLAWSPRATRTATRGPALFDGPAGLKDEEFADAGGEDEADGEKPGAGPREDFRDVQRRIGRAALPDMRGLEPGMREPNDPVPPAPPMADPRPAAKPMAPQEPMAEDREILEAEEVVGGLRARRLRFFEQEDAGNFRLRLLRLERLDDAKSQPVGWVREYAHAARADRKPGERRDFTETVYWHAGLKTDEHGKATISFDASDAITTVRLRADAWGADGALGAGEATVEVRRPFYVEPKFPLEVSAGDEVLMPLVLVNGTRASLPLSWQIEVGEGLRAMPLDETAKTLAADGSSRILLPLRVRDFRGASSLKITVDAGPYRDTVVREVQVVPAGFPIVHAFGGVLEGSAEHTFTIPEKIIAGSTTSEAAAYPTPLASMVDAMAALLREPGGCFEQTSSSNYPNVMALQYMESHHGVDPKLVARAKGMLERGYRKLVSFECKERGYEWFGGDPGHEALTAYGVLEFHDMAQVMDVDAEMISRTRTWLLARRDGKGGFQRNSRALDTFGRAPQEITDAYILWALLETEPTEDLSTEIATLKARARASEDTYLRALAANALFLAGETEEATRLRAQLVAAQAEDGHVDGASTSITRSGGTALDVETTSLAVLAWLRTDEHAAAVEKAMQWIASRCQRGRFGSTQSTILALKAIIAYDAKRARAKAPGTLTMFLDGQEVGRVDFTADHTGAIQLPDLREKLTPGTHTVRLAMEGGSAMPYAFAVRYAALTPASAAQTPVRVSTSLPKAEVGEGEPLEIDVKVVSTSSEGQPMTVAIVGLPGGLEARAEQLQELVKEGKVDFVETRGREVVLYWRSLAPEAVHELTIDTIAQIPGTYEGPASRAYLYYTDEHKHWVDGLEVTITPRD